MIRGLRAMSQAYRARCLSNLLLVSRTPEVSEETDRRYRRVGHQGADLIAPGNTLASFDAALEAGVDMIEFDILPEVPPRKGRPLSPGSGTLRLAHDYKHLSEVQEAVTLDEGLAHFASDAFAGVELDVDLKLPGYEREVVDALREHGLLERSLISTTYIESIDLIRSELAPEARLGLSVPHFKRDYSRHPVYRYPFLVYGAGYRLRLPARLAGAFVPSASTRSWPTSYRLITPRMVREVHGAGGELFAWTVDDPARIARLEALGVDGIITNDPRLARVMRPALLRSAGDDADSSAMALPANPLRVELDFEALYRSSRDDLYAYVAGLLRDRAAAEDVTALAFERALRRRRQFNARRGSERQWLFGIARNAALDELRRRGRRGELEGRSRTSPRSRPRRPRTWR